MRIRHKPKATDHGFTLVELLVVIGIIAVLVAMLLPSLSRAREEAFKIKCQSNCRNLLLAVSQYVNDNQTTLPFPNWGSGPGGYSAPGWLFLPPLNSPPPVDYANTGALYQYLNNLEVYHCPKDPGPYYSGPSEWLTSWLMNGSICGFGTVTSSGTYVFHRITQFHATDVVFWEAEEQITGTSAPWNDGSSYPPEAGITHRHLDHGAAMGCMDGHVEWWSQDDYAYQLKQLPGPLYCNPDTATGQ